MMASVVAGGRRRKSLTLRGVDPETCMIVFKNHWAQVTKPEISANLCGLCTDQTIAQLLLCPIFLIMVGRETVCVCVCV